MAQFYENIRVNNISLAQRYGLVTVKVTDNDISRIFGIERSIEVDDSVGDTPIFIKGKGVRRSFTIELCKIKSNGDIGSINENDLKDLGKLLFKNEIVMLEHKGLIYYGVFVNGSTSFDGANKGWITLEFEMVTPHPYSRIYIDGSVINDSKEMVIFNKSTLKDKVYLDINILKLGGSTIKIENITTGDYMIFNNVDVDEEIEVLGEGCLEINSVTNVDKNIFNDTEFNNFISLKYGKNIIKVTGECRVNFKYQVPHIMK